MYKDFKIQKFTRQHPCKNCPFRKDVLKGWLGKERAEEIAAANSFVCHKTVDHEHEESTGDMSKRKQCAGFLLLKGSEAQAVEMANVLQIDLNLQGRNLVFDTKEEFIKHHTRQ